MKRILLTGMSGTGKSSALAELQLLGFQVVDADEPGWTEWSDLKTDMYGGRIGSGTF